MEVGLPRNRLVEASQVFRHVSQRSVTAEPAVLVRTTPGAVTLIASDHDTAVACRIPSPGTPVAPQEFVVPLSRILGAQQAVEDAVVLDGDTKPGAELQRLSTLSFGGGNAATPVSWPAFRERLANAAHVVAAQQSRFALQRMCLQRRGVIATDGEQLYCGNSVKLPFEKSEEALISPTPILSARPLKDFETVAFSQDKTAVHMSFGDAWTLRLTRQEGRFPDWKSVIPAPSTAKATLIVTEEAAQLLLDRLPRKRSGGEESAVTLTLNGQAILRSDRASPGLTLPGASVKGSVDVMFAPGFLREALRMGFRSFRFVNSAAPIVAERETDLFLWMPIVHEEAAVAPSASRQPQSEVKETPMPVEKPQSNGTAPESPDITAVLTEVSAIQDALRDLSRRTANVHQAIRSYAGGLRKREKLVGQALAGLRALKNVAA